MSTDRDRITTLENDVAILKEQVAELLSRPAPVQVERGTPPPTAIEPQVTIRYVTGDALSDMPDDSQLSISQRHVERGAP
jgi:hypothetical protein